MNASEQLAVNQTAQPERGTVSGVNEATIPWTVADTADLGTDSDAITAENQSAAAAHRPDRVRPASAASTCAVDVADRRAGNGIYGARYAGQLRRRDGADAARQRISAPSAGARCAGQRAALRQATDADCAPGAGVDMTQILMGHGRPVYATDGHRSWTATARVVMRRRSAISAADSSDARRQPRRQPLRQKHRSARSTRPARSRTRRRRVFRGTIDFKTRLVRLRRQRDRRPCSCSATTRSTRPCPLILCAEEDVDGNARRDHRRARRRHAASTSAAAASPALTAEKHPGPRGDRPLGAARWKSETCCARQILQTNWMEELDEDVRITGGIFRC